MNNKEKMNIPRTIMIAFAYLPAVAFIALNLLYSLQLGDAWSEASSSTIISVIIIVGWLFLAYFISSRFTKQNMIGIIMMMVWIVFIFYDNSEKIPPSTSAIVFTAYFSLVLILNVTLRRREKKLS